MQLVWQQIHHKDKLHYHRVSFWTLFPCPSLHDDHVGHVKDVCEDEDEDEEDEKGEKGEDEHEDEHDEDGYEHHVDHDDHEDHRNLQGLQGVGVVLVHMDHIALCLSLFPTHYEMEEVVDSLFLVLFLYHDYYPNEVVVHISLCLCLCHDHDHDSHRNEMVVVVVGLEEVSVILHNVQTRKKRRVVVVVVHIYRDLHNEMQVQMGAHLVVLFFLFLDYIVQQLDVKEQSHMNRILYCLVH